MEWTTPKLEELPWDESWQRFYCEEAKEAA
jgi:hypothetical protein